MLSVFMTASSARGDDKRVVRGLSHLPEIGRRAAPHARNCGGRPALIDAQPAIHPVDLAAIAFGLAHQRGNHLLREEMVFLLDITAVYRVGMRRLGGKGL